VSRPLALLRPEPGWSASAAAARAAGVEVIGHPLFRAQPLDWELPDGEFDGLLIGSAAVFRHGGPQLAALRKLPVHAVGEATARAAGAAGFAVASTGAGGLQALLDAAKRQPARYLRLGGEERVRLAPHPGQSIAERGVYRMVSSFLDPGVAEALASRRPVVALHSAAAARHFASEIDRLGISRASLVLLALAPRIARAAGAGWAASHLADVPSDAALLAKAAALCK
jgi:uroporphyrinogen-III synthase